MRNKEEMKWGIQGGKGGNVGERGRGEIKWGVKQSCTSLFNGLTGNVESGSISMLWSRPTETDRLRNEVETKWIHVGGRISLFTQLCLERGKKEEMRKRQRADKSKIHQPQTNMWEHLRKKTSTTSLTIRVDLSILCSCFLRPFPPPISHLLPLPFLSLWKRISEDL